MNRLLIVHAIGFIGLLALGGSIGAQKGTIREGLSIAWMRGMTLFVILACLSACSHTSQHDRALIAAGQAAATLPAMSDSELTCAGEPRAPEGRDGKRVRESQTQNYILDLREAGADCRDKLGVARRVFRKVEEVRSRAVPPTTKGETK